jgi:hypothetical protein
VVLDPSATAILIPAATTIGSNTQQVIVEDEGAVLNCTGTTGADCIDLSSNGSLNCIKKGITSNSSGCQLTNSSSSNITSLITNTNHDGATGGTQFQLSGFQINPNNSSTITQAGLWLVAVEGNGSYIRDNAISGMVGTNSTCTGQPTGIYCVVSIEDGPVTGSTTDLVFDNNYFDCSAKAACVNLNIVSGAGSGVGQNLVFNNLDVGDGSQTTGCVRSFGCMINIDGSVSGTNTSHYVTGIIFNGLQMESGTSEGGDYINLKNARAVSFNDVQFSGGPALTYGLYIAQAGTGSVGVIKLTGRNLGGRISGASVYNTISGASGLSNSEPDIDYTYPGQNSVGTVIDGTLLVNGTILTQKTVSPGAAVSAVTLASPSVNTLYRVTLYIAQTSTGGCSGGATILPWLQWTDAGTGLAVVQAPFVYFGTTVGSTTSPAAASAAATGLTSSTSAATLVRGSTFGITIYASSTATLNYGVNFTNGSGCTTQPAYVIQPLVEQY